jgi:hypothetical protein
LVLKPTAPNIPTLVGQDNHGQPYELPYMHYSLVENEPLLLGTAGNNHNVYGDSLRVFPMPVLPFATNIDDSRLDMLYTDYPFNWTLNLALYQMGDAGVIADVH